MIISAHCFFLDPCVNTGIRTVVWYTVTCVDFRQVDGGAAPTTFSGPWIHPCGGPRQVFCHGWHKLVLFSYVFVRKHSAAVKIYKMRCRPGLYPPTRLGGAYSAPRTASWFRGQGEVKKGKAKRGTKEGMGQGRDGEEKWKGSTPTKQWRIQKFWRGGGRQFISPVLIYHKCTRKKAAFGRKKWANRGRAAAFESATATKFGNKSTPMLLPVVRV